jgi:IS6 family transposase
MNATSASIATACGVALADRSGRETGPVRSSMFAGFRFPPEVISVAVRWYLRCGLSYPGRGGTHGRAPHHRRYRHHLPMGQRFTPEFIEAARSSRHALGKRWFADETYVKAAGRWTYLSGHRRAAVCAAGPRGRPPVLHLRAALGDCLCRGHYGPGPAYPRVLDELIPSALHTVERYANNPVEADHGRLKARLRPMRDLKCHRSAHPGRRLGVRSETSAAASMNSPPTSPPATGSAQYSTSYPWPSDSRSSSSVRSVIRTDRLMQQCP